MKSRPCKRRRIVLDPPGSHRLQEPELSSSPPPSFVASQRRLFMILCDLIFFFLNGRAHYELQK